LQVTNSRSIRNMCGGHNYTYVASSPNATIHMKANAYMQRLMSLSVHWHDKSHNAPNVFSARMRVICNDLSR